MKNTGNLKFLVMLGLIIFPFFNLNKIQVLKKFPLHTWKLEFSDWFAIGNSWNFKDGVMNFVKLQKFLKSLVNRTKFFEIFGKWILKICKKKIKISGIGQK